jgi:hypothetical protein
LRRHLPLSDTNAEAPTIVTNGMNTFPIGAPEIIILVVLGALGYVAYRTLRTRAN